MRALRTVERLGVALSVRVALVQRADHLEPRLGALPGLLVHDGEMRPLVTDDLARVLPLRNALVGARDLDPAPLVEGPNTRVLLVQQHGADRRSRPTALALVHRLVARRSDAFLVQRLRDAVE